MPEHPRADVRLHSEAFATIHRIGRWLWKVELMVPMLWPDGTRWDVRRSKYDRYAIGHRWARARARKLIAWYVGKHAAMPAEVEEVRL
jgi:hypothetical protein